MAKNILSQLVVQMTVENAQFQKELEKATAKQAAFANQNTKTSASISVFEKGLSTATKVTAGFAVAIGGLAIAQERVKDLENLATISGLTTDEFLNLSRATQTLGIDSDKLGDIFKDTREKLGEFIATGGGGFADFFEQVGTKANIAAKELEHLSGPEILQRVKQAMDAANLSAAKQSFYLESIASDTTNLLPILSNLSTEYNKIAVDSKTIGDATKNLATSVALLITAADKELGTSNFLIELIDDTTEWLDVMRKGGDGVNSFSYIMNQTFKTMASLFGDVTGIFDEVDGQIETTSTALEIKLTPAVNDLRSSWQRWLDQLDLTSTASKQALASISNFAAGNFKIMGDFVAGFAGEASGAYKLLFALQKAAAIPSILVSTEEAAMKSLTIDPSGAMASYVRGMGQLSAAIVAGQSIAGVFHGGGAVPGGNHERTYLLKGGEYVESRAERRQIDEALSQRETVNIDLSYTIQALDSRGVAQVLNDNAEMVYNAVNKVFNEQGRRL